MDQTFRSLLLRYQNYLLEVFQLIEDKELIDEQNHEAANHIKKFLENLPELNSEFELALSISKTVEDHVSTWSIDITDEGFSFRSFSTDSNIGEIDEWYLHYYDSTKEYEGNLFNDGDWDLYLEEIADLDEYEGGKLSAQFIYRVG
ncbi:hypothetical protein Pedsa_1067 [Pseudopedobacter saltans DSM 12145]|uniref:Uncharacterized protein n=1 Tax=Pseudopedobacter saltans (strain ATCC 51119 / DSM 12145 / JCM 21818 / CCUG 39354 / LMG 10337 / NBRC 100064 / NCIMB 13643) TaxID=762903 RepID=F0SBJ1_PSESL|nr:hypothetical protein [Pseudopedobacter saltans]ADY51637.1 hypothetical protein Pedsa_1067 [Pseudopedobacter saltans DSM 12145]